MEPEAWSAVDDHLAQTLVGDDPAMTLLLEYNAAQGLPPIDVSPPQGKLLMLLCQMMNARSVLEIGTLGGYSTTWLARGVGDGGHVVTLEVDAHHAEVARANIDRAGVGDRVDIQVGPAIESLPTLVDSQGAPFDLVFIDADKQGYPDYLAAVMRLVRPGSVIVGDNVVRGGAVIDVEGGDDDAAGVRTFLDALRDHPGIDATAIQTVGSKGWDGFALAVVGEGD